MNDATREHKAQCENWTGLLLEDAVITCEVDADTGECTRHDFSYGDVPIVRSCEGCGEEIERFRKVVETGS